MAAPVTHVGALAVKDIAKGRVPGVAGAAQHGVVALDLAGEQDAVAVVGQEGVLHLVEGLKVVGIGHADRRAVVAVAPGHIVAVLDPADARVVLVLDGLELGDVGDKLDRLLQRFPSRRHPCSSAVDQHLACPVVHAKNPREPVLKWDDSTVKDAVRAGEQVPGNDRIPGRAPHHLARARRPLLPGDIGQGRSYSRRVRISHVSRFLPFHCQDFSRRFGMPSRSASQLRRSPARARQATSRHGTHLLQGTTRLPHNQLGRQNQPLRRRASLRRTLQQAQQ